MVNDCLTVDTHKILTDLPVTGVADDKVLKMVKTNKCPVKAQQPLKLKSKQKPQKGKACQRLFSLQFFVCS